MKKILTFLMFFLLATIAAQAETVSFDYSKLKAGELCYVTNYVDKSSYLLVPKTDQISIAYIKNIFSNKQISSDITITLDVATYGNGNNPSSSTFSFFSDEECTNSITSSTESNFPTSSTYVSVEYIIKQNETTKLTNGLAIKINKNSGKQIRLRKITVNFDTSGGGEVTPTLSSIAVKTAPAKVAYMEGQTFDPTGLVITKTMSDETTEDVTYSSTTASDFTFNPSLSTELTNQTNVTIGYGGKTTNQAITVTPFTPNAGEYTISLNKDFYGISAGSNGTEQSNTKFGIKVVSGCTSSAQNKTYYDAAHIRYYADSYLKLTAPSGFEITKVEFTAGGTWNSGPNSGSNGSYSNDTKIWEGKSSQIDFSFSDQNRISSIKVTYAQAKTLQSIAVSGTPAEFWKGDAFNYDGITVTATWEDEKKTDVTSSCEFSGYDMSTAGQQTVTVTYQDKTATYNIVVKTIANTQETAYTAAEAIALINANKDLATQVYVKGTVSSIVTEYSEQYGNITFNIEDGFQFYRNFKGADNTKWTSTDELPEVGDQVVGFGTLAKHNSTYEFAAGNYIVSMTKPVVTKYQITIDSNIEHGTVTASVAEAAEGAPVTLTATPADGYKFEAWSVTNATTSEAITVTDNQFTMPASDVKVSATFVEKTKYEIAWMVNGAELEDETKEYVEGSLITAPENPKNIADYKFVGWSKKSDASSVEDIEDFTNYIVQGDENFYAVFAKVTSGNKTEITDVITRETTGKENGATGYSDWSNKKVNSDAIYAGNSAGGNNSIQIRTDTGTSGIYTTQSGGYLKKISVVFESHTTDARTLNVYGNTIPYTKANELYNGDTDGDKLGSFKYIKNEDKEYIIDNIPANTYTHVGFKSNSGAMYISSISITWVTGTPDTYSDYTTIVNVQNRDFYLNHTWGGTDAWWNKLIPTGDGTYSLNAVCGDSYNDITVGSNYKQAQQSRYLKEDNVIPTDQWNLESTETIGEVSGETCTFAYNPVGNVLTIVSKDVTYYIKNRWKSETTDDGSDPYTWRPLNRANPDGTFSTTGYRGYGDYYWGTNNTGDGTKIEPVLEGNPGPQDECTYTFDYNSGNPTLTIKKNSIITGVEDVEVAGSAVKAYKTIENGQVIIVRGDQRFNIMGQPVR